MDDLRNSRWDFEELYKDVIKVLGLYKWLERILNLFGYEFS